MAIKSLFWRLLYRRWRTAVPARREPGYSMLLPVPGDLPVFLELALAVAKRQDPAHRVETLVLPDLTTDRVRAIVAREADTWPGGALRLVELPRPDRWIPRYMNHPHANYWLQLMNGAENARAQYALAHDADLFLHDQHFLTQQFMRCQEGRFACFGVNRVWDSWFEERGLAITATWELFFDVEWLRSFTPFQHMGHDDTLNGERHTFDVTLLPQCLTAPERIGWHTPAGGFVHFNYVICTYRFFQASRGPFSDDNFRILLVRLLINLFDRQSTDYEAPAVEELACGLSDAAARVTYTSDQAAKNYAEFRDKFAELLDGPLLDDAQKERARMALQPFDTHFQ